jgi:hypothetical protein
MKGSRFTEEQIIGVLRRKNWDEHETKATNDAPQEGEVTGGLYL